MHLPANGKTLLFPSADGAFVTLQIGSDLLPRIESLLGILAGANLRLGFAGTHERTLRRKRCWDCSLAER
jgi:hypothetical protein